MQSEYIHQDMETASPIALARRRLGEHAEFQILPSRYWSVANHLLGLIDVKNPADWISVPIASFAILVGKAACCVSDALTWLQDNDYAVCVFDDDKTHARVKLLASFRRPLGLD